MTAGTTIRQQDIVLVPFPYSDFSMYKKRQVLILSNNEYNIANEDVICCAITSNPRAYKGSIPIYNDNLECGNLKQKSRIKPNKIFTLNQKNILKKIAKLDTESTKQVTQEIMNIIASEN
jgi:mRNA interferase MazF